MYFAAHPSVISHPVQAQTQAVRLRFSNGSAFFMRLPIEFHDPSAQFLAPPTRPIDLAHWQPQLRYVNLARQSWAFHEQKWFGFWQEDLARLTLSVSLFSSETPLIRLQDCKTELLRYLTRERYPAGDDAYAGVLPQLHSEMFTAIPINKQLWLSYQLQDGRYSDYYVYPVGTDHYLNVAIDPWINPALDLNRKRQVLDRYIVGFTRQITESLQVMGLAAQEKISG